MNPTSTLRMRRWTAFVAMAWALLAIFLSLASLRIPPDDLSPPFSDSRLGGRAVIEVLAPSAAETGASSGDRILEIDGVPYLYRLREGSDWLRAGVPNEYLVEKRDGRQIRFSLPPVSTSVTRTPVDRLFHALLLVVALIYLVTGGAVWWMRPDRSGAWALLLFCSTMSVQLATVTQTDDIPWSFPRLMLNLPLIGAATFHLFTSYPIEPDWIVRHRRTQVLPYLAAFLLGAFAMADHALGLRAGLGSLVALSYTLGLFVVSFVIVAFERHRHGEGAQRDHADVVFFGALVSFLPVLAGLVAELTLDTPFPFYVPLIWTFVFPLAVGYGIVRRQLVEVRSLAKSSAAYGAATLGITGAFALAISFADALVARFGVSERPAQVALLFVAILLFNPVRNRMQALVDRFFDRDRAAYRVAVREISEAMVSMLSLGEIADRILVALTDTMGVERAMVLLVDDKGKLLQPIASRGEWDEDALETEIPSDHPLWKHLWMRREDLARGDFDDEHDLESREACRDVFDTLEVELLVPVLYGVDLLGVIAVGRKLSGDRLAADDRVLLRTLANQSSIAIENAKAFDEIAKLNETLEARVEERTRELREIQAQLTQAEKMKSLGQLVAGVAHELNNPIGFVHANLQLLEENIQKLVEGQQSASDTARIRETIDKLLSRSREGTQRVKKIVQDLRTFSRMDQAELQDADLHEEIDRTLALMEPRFKNAIQVVRDYGDLPRVRCYPGQLNQVFLNLLMNACDAIDGEGVIRIETRRSGNGVTLAFHDSGPGIPLEIQSRIFDPFFTTKPVGVGTGLGLSLSHGIIERHGGRIRVESEPGRGATFVVDLPLDASLVEATNPPPSGPGAPGLRA